MAENVTPENWLERTKKTWGLLAEAAVFIFAIVGSFLLPPPGWTTATGDTTLVRLAQFTLAVLVGLFLLLAMKWNRPKHVARWAVICVMALLFSLLAYFGSQKLGDARTCEYGGQIVAIGTEYTEHMRTDYLNENPGVTCETMLNDHAGKVDDIWTQESINNSRYILAATYIGIMPLFAVCIIAVVQAIYCRGNRRVIH